MVELVRRSFITGLISLIAAPAIVRAGSLMPVKAYLEVDPSDIVELLRRLEERSELHDHAYAGRYGLPIMGEIDPKTRQISAVIFRG